MRKKQPQTQKNTDAPAWVSASQIAQAHFCPYQLYLQNNGVPLDKKNQRSLQIGTSKHQAFNEKQQQNKKSHWWIVLIIFATGLLAACLLLFN